MNKLTILVTGSAGFLGGHTYRYMKEQGHKKIAQALIKRLK